MSSVIAILAQAPPNAPEVIKLGEQIMFWVLGPVSLIGAMGMLFARNAVHSALWLVLTMLSLGVLYIVQQAPFLGVVQIIVYTGAIMMLFLFVLMLVGRDSSDSVVEVLRGQRLTATFLGLGLAALLVAALSRAFTDVPSTGLAKVNGSEGPGNVLGLGQLIFREYVFAFELTSALLITAALGAMLLAFVDKEHSTKRSQRELVEARLRGEHDRPSPLPGPGVFATANSVATPALLPDGSVAPESLSKIIESTSRERLADDITEVKGAGPQPDAHALTGPSSKDKKSGAEEGKA